MYRVVIIGISSWGVNIWHGGWCTSTRAILAVALKQSVGTMGHRAVASWIIVIGAVGVGIAVSVAAVSIIAGIVVTTLVVVAVVASVGVTAWLLVVHVDSLICLVIVGGHGKGSLVGINVFTTTNLAVVVARKVSMKVVVVQGVERDKGCAAEK